MPKEEKIRGVNSFSTPYVLCCCAWCLDPMRVVVRLWVWESLKTLFYEIMLLCDFICFGYGHVFMVTVLACHILCLNCFISIWFAVEILLLPDWHSQDGSAALCCISQNLVCLNWLNMSYASSLFLWHLVQHPTAGMDVGGGSHHT
jgi:hypothetical protein